MPCSPCTWRRPTCRRLARHSGRPSGRPSVAPRPVTRHPDPQLRIAPRRRCTDVPSHCDGRSHEPDRTAVRRRLAETIAQGRQDTAQCRRPVIRVPSEVIDPETADVRAAPLWRPQRRLSQTRTSVEALFTHKWANPLQIYQSHLPSTNRTPSNVRPALT